MDLFDEVLNIEENAYKEGERIGKERGQKIIIEKRQANY